MIVAETLTRYYGKFEAVSKISFTATSGEVVGLLGQNGAGKSTIMNMLAGCLTPSSGRIFINQYDLKKNPLEAKNLVGYLPEVPPLYTELTVREYLKFCCRLKRVHPKDENQHIEEIMTLAGITQVQRQVIGSLSKGYRQRTGLAQALCGNPEVLLLDEPTAGFDPKQAVDFRKLIRTLAKDKTILFSSHLLSEVQEICDRVLIIHQGKLMMDHKMSQKDGSMSYRLIAQAAPSRVLPPLRQLNSVQRVKTFGEAKPDETRVIVQTDKSQDFISQLFTLLSGLNAPIMELTPMQDTLESLFLKVTTQSGTQTQ
ncbi:MAG: ABC transporter ATP-binding protein [Clostridiales bacterium]|nr:ABC transporter ATP-binding protein [Clostridiales bacterium]